MIQAINFAILGLFLSFSIQSARADIKCSGDSQGEKIKIDIQFDVLKSSPPQDSVSIKIGEEFYGPYGKHDLAFFPGGVAFKERFYGINDVSGELLLFPSKKRAGTYDLELRSSGNASRILGLNCKVHSDSFYRPSLSLTKKAGIEKLVKSISQASDFDRIASEALYIIQNLVGPVPQSHLVYEAILKSERLNWESSEARIPEPYHRFLWAHAYEQLLNDASVSDQHKAELISFTFSKGSAREIVLVTLSRWDSIKQTRVSQENLLTKVLEKIDLADSHAVESLAGVVFPDELKGLPSRMRALEMVFEKERNSRELRTLSLFLSNWADDWKSHSDLDSEIVDRFIRHPNFDAEVGHSILERVFYGKNGFTHKTVLSREMQVRVLKKLLESPKLLLKDRQISEMLVRKWSDRELFRKVVDSEEADELKLSKLRGLVETQSGGASNIDFVLRFLSSKTTEVKGASEFVRLVLSSLEKMDEQDLYYYLEGRHGVLMELFRLAVSPQAEFLEGLDDVAGAVARSHRLTRGLIASLSYVLLHTDSMGKMIPVGSRADLLIANAMGKLLSHALVDDEVAFQLAGHLSRHYEEVPARKQWAEKMLRSIAGNEKLSAETREQAQLVYDPQPGKARYWKAGDFGE
ncbi:MAG: hypothetical protein AB1540_13375 [Bdellovibrionota bacterium]